jgi:hypothetical protein
MQGVTSLGRSVDRLKLPEGFGDALPEKPGEGEPDDGVRATRLMPDLHVVPGLWSPVKMRGVRLRPRRPRVRGRLAVVGPRGPLADEPCGERGGRERPMLSTWLAERLQRI